MPIVKEALRRITGMALEVEVIVQKKNTPDVFSDNPVKKGKPKSLIRLNPRYTFDEFVVGDSTDLPMLEPEQWQKTPERDSTHCSYGRRWAGQKHTFCMP